MEKRSAKGRENIPIAGTNRRGGERICGVERILKRVGLHAAVKPLIGPSPAGEFSSRAPRGR
eukprot:1191690-Prorocentrum_minimum.AAC.2